MNSFHRNEEDNNFPACYSTANSESEHNQKTFLWLVRGEYFTLILCSVLALDLWDARTYFAAYSLALIGGLFLTLARNQYQPEQKWYRARAVSESIKTSAWRYMMRAHPYEARDDQVAKTEFLTSIQRIITANGSVLSGRRAVPLHRSQITIYMDNIRKLDLSSRIDIYRSDRILNQQQWYISKAKQNRLLLRRWTVTLVAMYILAICLAVSHIVWSGLRHLPIEPILLLASSVIGWMQTKKHAELASSYTLTAWEIDLADEEIQGAITEQRFAEFVNNTELAFSREHTQWVARQKTAG